MKKKKRKIDQRPEQTIQKQLVAYIRLQYPKALMIANPQSSIKMTVGQAVKAKTQGFESGQPDLMLVKKKKKPGIKFAGVVVRYSDYSGLAIELKKDGIKLFKKWRQDKVIGLSGTAYRQWLKAKMKPWKTEHLETQFNYLMRLKAEGFKVSFAIGFDKAKKIIDQYMKG